MSDELCGITGCCRRSGRL